MRLYYLTEMNLLKLENIILKFIQNNHIEQTLTNGIIGKIAAMMYKKRIDYYYPDYLATTLNHQIVIFISSSIHHIFIAVPHK